MTGLKTENEIEWFSLWQGLCIEESANTENTRRVSVSKSSEIHNTHPSFRVVDQTYYIGIPLRSAINTVYIH
jgi:hypothetical protein